MRIPQKTGFAFLFLISCSGAAAFDPGEFGVSREYTPVSYSQTDVPGEMLDYRTGKLFWHVEEGVLTAQNGMTFPVVRSYVPGFSGAQHFENWDLDLPRIEVPTHGLGLTVGRQQSGSSCNGSVEGLKSPLWNTRTITTHYSIFGDIRTNKEPEYQRGHALLRVPGHSPMPMLTKAEGDTRFPASAIWVTGDNWYVSCLPGDEGFLAVSPEGERYYMTVKSRTVGSWEAFNPFPTGQLTYHVSKIENAFGDSFSFAYEDVEASAYDADYSSTQKNWLTANVGKPNRQYLTGISTRVTGPTNGVTFDAPLLTVTYSSATSYGYKRVSRLSFIIDGSYLNPANHSALAIAVQRRSRNVDYHYASSKWITDAHYCNSMYSASSTKSLCASGQYNSAIMLNRASYADGSESVYWYKGPPMSVVRDGTSYTAMFPLLTDVVHRSGLHISYEYESKPEITWGISSMSYLYENPAIYDILNTVVISKRKVRDTARPSPDLREFETLYSYQQDGDEYSLTTAISGKRKETRKYYRTKSGLDPNGAFFFERFDTDGLLKEVTITAIGGSHNEVQVRQTYDYYYLPYGQDLSSHFNGPDRLFFAPDGVSNKRAHITKVTELSGFSRDILLFDGYGFPARIEETSPSSGMRVTELSYEHPYVVSGGQHYILGRLTEKLVDGKSVYEALYNWLGKPLEERTGNKNVSYSYTASVIPQYYPYGIVQAPWHLNLSQIIMDNSVIPHAGNTGLVGRADWNATVPYWVAHFGHIAGQPSVIQWSDDAIDRRIVNTEGRVSSSTDHNSFQSTFQYDTAGRLISYNESQVDGVQRTGQITWNGPFQSIETSAGQQTHRRYLGTGQMYREEITDLVDGGPVIRIDLDYDQYGNKVLEKGVSIDGVRPSSTYEYTVHQTLAREEHQPAGLVRNYCHSLFQSCQGIPGSASLTMSSNDGVVEKQRLYGFGSQELVEDQTSFYRGTTLEKRVSVDYNKQLQPETVTAGSVVRQYQYNSQGALISQTDPESGVRQITEYYPDGNIKEMSHGGRNYVFRYSNRGLREEEEISGNVVRSFVYAAGGALQSATNHVSDVETTYNYLSNGLLKSETVALDAQSFSFEYGYRQDGTLNSITYPSGKSYDINTTGRGWMLGVPGYLSVLEHANNGVPRVIALGSSGVEVARYFNPDGSLKVLSAQAGYGTLLRRVYDYDAFGNLIDVDDLINTMRNVTNTFDAAGRLASSSGAWGARHYHYDHADNMRGISATPSGPKSILDVAYGADNLPSGMNGQGGSRVLDHDEFGRMTDYGLVTMTYNADDSVAELSSATGLTAYDHDHAGNIVYQSSAASGDLYLVRSTPLGAVAYEKNATTGIASDYLLVGTQRMARVDTIPDTDSDGDGIPDAIELELGLNPLDSADATADTDGDGLTNLQEYLLGTNMHLADTDGDGIADGVEVTLGSDPLRSDAYEDLDGDGIPNVDQDPDEGNDGAQQVDPAIITIIVNSVIN